ncbi:hypothetical protein KQ940_18685 [Marinobacterium sp. D7]|uniref:hypothetical protein n=1 Tax=Marinobacterium ramblicola TaxID=2849041 RepID=UPI001C2DC14C|nr:hypothetical protein [Marinobacterium ramblicola]MBV1790087.1 hypothetical protein [Marinobacterium ramblicola]
MTSLPSPISYIRHPDNTPLSLDARPSLPPNKPPLPLGLICNSLQELANGTLVEISSPHLAPDMRSLGQIIWCRRLGDRYQLGVAFYSSEDLYTLRMMEQLCHIEHYRHILDTEGQPSTLEHAAREWVEKFAEQFPTEGL